MWMGPGSQVVAVRMVEKNPTEEDHHGGLLLLSDFFCLVPRRRHHVWPAVQRATTQLGRTW